jgi:hypothetical protein
MLKWARRHEPDPQPRWRVDQGPSLIYAPADQAAQRQMRRSWPSSSERWLLFRLDSAKVPLAAASMTGALAEPNR